MLRQQITARASGNTLMVLAPMRYAAIHQFGGKIERAAYSKLVRHRTNSRGELLRSAVLNGKGLIFAKNSHKDSRVKTRWFEVGAHSITIHPRPYMPVRADGSLYADEQRLILAEIEAWVAGRAV